MPPAEARARPRTRIVVFAEFLWLLFAATLFTLIATEDLPLAARRLLALYAAVLALVLHEAAHALVARSLGLAVPRIEFRFLFGAAHIERPREPHQEFLVAAAGPAVNLLCAGATLFLIGVPLELDSLMITSPTNSWLFANLLMGTLNLLPAFPMDGGRMLRALLWRGFGFEGATRAALWISRAVLLVLALSPILLPLGLPPLAFAPLTLIVLWLLGAESQKAKSEASSQRKTQDP